LVQSEVSAQPELIVEMKDVHFSYLGAKPRRNVRPVLHIPHWQVAAGQQLFIQGPSGCGKTTLLNLLTGMLTPDSGSICLLNENLATMSGHQRDRFRARHIGVVFQQFNLISYLSVADNIRLAAHFGEPQQKGQGKLADSKIAALLDQLHMPASLLTQRADSLSVGQQQRVAIARALINEPEILVVDEPTSALDSAASDAFMTLLLDVSRSNNSTLLFVSHDQRLAANFDKSVCLPELNRAATDAA